MKKDVGFSSIQKCIATMRMLAYGVSRDPKDERRSKR
jgi:hypothetical protein